MAAPILKLGDYLVVTVPTELSDAAWLGLQHEVLERVGAIRARGVLMDVALLDVLDSFATRVLRSTVQMLKLRGAAIVIVGLQPDVALSMVQLGLISRLHDIDMAMDIEEGLALLDARMKAGSYGD